MQDIAKRSNSQRDIMTSLTGLLRERSASLAFGPIQVIRCDLECVIDPGSKVADYDVVRRHSHFFLEFGSGFPLVARCSYDVYIVRHSTYRHSGLVEAGFSGRETYL